MTRAGIKVEVPELRLDPEAALKGLDWAVVFGEPGPVEVEIGIGKGRFILASAASRPHVFHLGVEWANKYLRIAEARAHKRDLDNVRFVRVDARELLAVVPAASVSAYYVFYPDPWPKKRHHKRRLLSPHAAEHFARTLTPEGLLHVSTDHAEYWEVVEAVLGNHPAFSRLPEFGGSEFPLPVDQPLTNFEVKYRGQGRACLRASWRRVAGLA